MNKILFAVNLINFFALFSIINALNPSFTYSKGDKTNYLKRNNKLEQKDFGTKTITL